MATQSLYRRFRPRKFSELYGQEHVVRALRNAVINGREGQAYLFSGPRGTGKTTTARILAKVLNCEAPSEGEPCCGCDSCRAVEAGNSYDVLELDAASNNGVEEVRELIASAALTSPGRHRVFILDEAHMLSRPAEAALLKTLEEPPEHVVFVLATTDPQKISETIRSRVQHLQFHLLPVEELEKYVRHVVASAGLEVSDDDIDLVLRQGGGSARDTLSALELVVSGGSEPEAVRATDELIDALVARDQARVLAAVASAVNLGRDPRGLAEDIVRSMRDSFLAVLSPELVQLPADTVRDLAARARSLGNRTVVRIMEVLGTTLVEMRHAPDPRLLLEVALVRIAVPDIDDSADVLAARVAALEEKVSNIVSSGGVPLAPAPVNESTGRARIGGRAAPTGGTTRPVPDAPAASPAPASPPDPAPAADVPAGEMSDPARMWPQIVESLKPLARAIFKPASVESVNDNVVLVRLPANMPLTKAEEQKQVLVESLRKLCGARFTVAFSKDDTGAVARPEASKPPTIVEQVAQDDLAPVDPADILPGEASDNLALDALHEMFPGGRVEKAPAPRGKKKQ
ncbi:MAG: polymerase gamma/tau subunit [Actinomycetota bacterium]